MIIPELNPQKDSSKLISIFYILIILSFLGSCGKSNKDVDPLNSNSKKDNVFVCDDNGTCSLLNAKTGDVVWSFKTEPFIVSSPTYLNNTLFFASTQDDAKHKIIALNYENGSKKWEYFTSGNNTSSPLAINDKVYYLSWGKLLCLEANSGKLNWETTSSTLIDSSPVYYDGNIYLVGNQGLEIVDAENGKKFKNIRVNNTKSINDVSKVNGFESYHSSPLIQNDVCYYVYNNKLYGYNLKTNQNTIQTLSIDEKFRNYSSPSMYNDILFYNRQDGLYGYKASELVQKIKFETGLRNHIMSSPLAVNDNVLFSVEDKLFCYDLNNLNQKWSHTAYQYSSPNYFDSIVYIASNTEILALDFLTGKTIWKNKLQNNILGHIPSPLIVTEEGKAYHTAISGAKD